MLMGDLNVKPTEAIVSDFCEIYNLKHTITEKTCFKNPTKPVCIDLIVTNRLKCFQDTAVFETRSSVFIRWVVQLWKCTILSKSVEMLVSLGENVLGCP